MRYLSEKIENIRQLTLSALKDSEEKQPLTEAVTDELDDALRHVLRAHELALKIERGWTAS